MGIVKAEHYLGDAQGHLASPFLAVRGIMETTCMFRGSKFIFLKVLLQKVYSVRLNVSVELCFAEKIVFPFVLSQPLLNHSSAHGGASVD